MLNSKFLLGAKANSYVCKSKRKLNISNRQWHRVNISMSKGKKGKQEGIRPNWDWNSKGEILNPEALCPAPGVGCSEMWAWKDLGSLAQIVLQFVACMASLLGWLWSLSCFPQQNVLLSWGFHTFGFTFTVSYTMWRSHCLTFQALFWNLGERLSEPTTLHPGCLKNQYHMHDTKVCCQWKQ